MSSGSVKVELYMDGDPLDPKDDRRILKNVGIRDRNVSSLDL